MILINNKSECCGCTACFNICGHKAITMTPDSQGFLYPAVDASKCSNCGLCERVCAFNDDYSRADHLDAPIVFAARHSDIEEVRLSRSGAVFVALSDDTLSKGGAVYGAVLDENRTVRHIRATSKDGRDSMRGSKYVQSFLGESFKMVEQDLKNGIDVLFSGTPCQTAGLNSYLSLRHISVEHLTVLDIVCHGTPSQSYLDGYIAYITKRHGKVVSMNFRDKNAYGWLAHKETFVLENGKTVTDRFSFYQQQFLRESCNTCHFSNTKRPSDITIGDYWGWERTKNDIGSDNKGVSLVLVNSPKGLQAFNNIKDKLYVVESSLEKAIQPNLEHPTPAHPDRERFCSDYAAYGFEKACKNQRLIGPVADIRHAYRKYISIARRILHI